jgi:hypothetical protein
VRRLVRWGRIERRIAAALEGWYGLSIRGHRATGRISLFLSYLL